MLHLARSIHKIHRMFITAAFPNVVGCDLYRATRMIRFHLPNTNVKFKIVPYLRNRKHKPVFVEQNQVILYYDEKYQAVALTPRFAGYKEADDYESNDTRSR